MVWFVDRHHDGLAFSLRLLAKRLNAEIYFPIGMEWWENGYWDINKPYNNSLDTAKQYLLLDHRYKPTDGTLPLNTIKQIKSNYYEVEDLAHGDILRAITFDQFLEMDIDIIIASIPDHWITYTKLRDKYKPRAKVICQAGNMFNEVSEWLGDGTIKNFMASTIEFPVPSNVNKVFYHQEQPIIHFSPPPKESRKISSLVHLLPKPEVFYQYKELLPEFDFRAYGANCPDGLVNGLVNVYKTMQENCMGFNVKPRGDGMGHIWHSWFMVGRGVITNLSDYKDKLGGLLFEDGITGVDLEAHTVEENCQLLRKADFERLGVNARKKFEEIVNYDQEQKEIEKFLSRLI